MELSEWWFLKAITQFYSVKVNLHTVNKQLYILWFLYRPDPLNEGSCCHLHYHVHCGESQQQLSSIANIKDFKFKIFFLSFVLIWNIYIKLFLTNIPMFYFKYSFKLSSHKSITTAKKYIYLFLFLYQGTCFCRKYVQWYQIYYWIRKLSGFVGASCLFLDI